MCSQRKITRWTGKQHFLDLTRGIFSDQYSNYRPPPSPLPSPPPNSQYFSSHLLFNPTRCVLPSTPMLDQVLTRSSSHACKHGYVSYSFWYGSYCFLVFFSFSVNLFFCITPSLLSLYVYPPFFNIFSLPNSKKLFKPKRYYPRRWPFGPRWLIPPMRWEGSQTAQSRQCLQFATNDTSNGTRS